MDAWPAQDKRTTLSAPRWTWASLPFIAAVQFMLCVLQLTTEVRSQPWAAWIFLCAGFVLLAQAWWLATERVHLTPDVAVAARGFRRRTIPWSDVQAVELVHRPWRGDAVVITPRDGTPVTALVRRSSLMRRDDSIERNLRLLEQWWHDRRDASAHSSTPTPRR